MTTYMRARPTAAPERPRGEVRAAEAASSTAEATAKTRRIVRVLPIAVRAEVRLAEKP